MNMRRWRESSTVERTRPVQSHPPPRRMRSVRYKMSKQPRRTKNSKDDDYVGPANRCMGHDLGLRCAPPPLAPLSPLFPPPYLFAGAPPLFFSASSLMPPGAYALPSSVFPPSRWGPSKQLIMRSLMAFQTKGNNSEGPVAQNMHAA